MTVKIKGVNDSLVLFFDQGDYDEQFAFLKERFINNQQLFSGSRIVFQGPALINFTREQMAALQALCLEHGMVLNNFQTQSNPKPERKKHDLNLRRNVRSGQKIRSEGSVVVWGDVHESAEITAVGDIVVLGRLQGVAHAGCNGDMESIIFALELSPTQLRIGNRVSRASGDKVKADYPEYAYWDSENICIREYNPRESFSRLNNKNK